MMKKALSMLLVVCLMLSLSVSVFAATMTPVTDKAAIAAGEDVTVTLTLDEADDQEHGKCFFHVDAPLLILPAAPHDIPGGAAVVSLRIRRKR